MSWYTENGPQNDVVVSSRIRLARNISGIPFPNRLNAVQLKEINSKIKKAVGESKLPIAEKLKYIEMDSVPETERFSMVERHIISREFANNYKGRAILLSEDESVCVMLAEEDHIRIQVIFAGFNLEKCYKTACEVDKLFCESLDIAYNEKLGFLTECTTNLGTGLRASVMLHLPMLDLSGEFKSISESAGKLGFAVRGLYGEGSKATASLYQISNQITLGISENDAIENLGAITKQLIEKEREYRNSANRLKLEDICMRALGTLKYAQILSSNEMTELVGKINLGKSIGIIKDKDLLPFKIFFENGPYMIMRTKGEMSPDDRDIIRAQEIRSKLRNVM